MALSRFGVRSLCGLVVLGVTLSAQTPPQFDVASMKRNTSADLSNPSQTLPSGEVRVMNTPVRNLILRAYPLDSIPIQVLGLPGWAEVQGERYDVIAKGKPGASAAELQQMWRALFLDRMKLAAHYETREQSGYNLVFARPDHTLGPGLKPSTLDCATLTARPQPGVDIVAFAASHCGISMTDFDGTMRSGGLTMAALVATIARSTGRSVTDKTGLTGFYNVALRFQYIPMPAGREPSPDDPPSVFTALPEQLGLKLESVAGTAQILVVDHIERPTEN